MLYLKRGAQVILLKNLDPERGLVNGSRGVVTRFEKVVPGRCKADDEYYKQKDCSLAFPVVKFANGVERRIVWETWELYQGPEVIARRSQIPLLLGWALSIHKSQGMSLDRVETDLSCVFEPGQSYVALSRCTSLQGLRLLSFNARKVWADAKVISFYERMPSQAV